MILDMSKELLVIPLNAEILSRTPTEAVELIMHLLERVTKLEAQNRELLAQNAVFEKRIAGLKFKLNLKSTNSNKPPSSSSDSPFDKKQRVSREKEENEKWARKGYERKRLDPTDARNVRLRACSCGCTNHMGIEPYYNASSSNATLRSDTRCGAAGVSESYRRNVMGNEW